MIPKDGGNVLSGTAQIAYSGPDLQSNNINDELIARGLDSSTRGLASIKKFIEGTAGVGGPIMRDRLWFYGSARKSVTQQYAAEPGKWRVAVGTAGLDATELPYRWGLGGDLAPGATTSITGQIKMTQDFKTTNFWAALVEEPSKVVQTGVGMPLVTSLPENLAIVAVDAANVRSSPSIAASVLDQVKYGTELQIVGQSADWFKVKLPDQREGWVAAGWIVTAAR
jgi:hypothetical protein